MTWSLLRFAIFCAIVIIGTLIAHLIIDSRDE